jgi:hypothetical protein
MPNKKKIKLIKIGQKTTKVLWVVFLLCFLFPRRFLLTGLEDNLHGQVVVFTNWFFYWVEFLLPVVLLGFLVFFQKANLKYVPKIIWGTLFALMMVCGVGIFLHGAPHFDALFLYRLMELWAVSYLVACQLVSFRVLLSVLLVSLGLQGVLGVLQLFLQGSVGLGVIGEQSLSPDTLGIAKIDIGDTKYIRPVGTLTHANAWGAMALLAIGLLPFWSASMLGENKQVSLQKIRRKVEKNIWVGVGVVVMGLFFGACSVLSFSRGAWIGLGLIIFAILWNRKYRAKALAPLVGVMAVVGVWQWDLIWQRVVDWKVAIFSRTEMLGYAMDLINTNPLGVGVGNFTVALEHDSSLRMFAPWELQPVHNVFLLAGAELGVLAMFVLLVGGFLLAWKSLRCSLLSLVLLLVMLPSLLTDHFFWTDFGMMILLVIVISVREIYWRQKSVQINKK